MRPVNILDKISDGNKRQIFGRLECIIHLPSLFKKLQYLLFCIFKYGNKILLLSRSSILSPSNSLNPIPRKL